MYYFSGYEFTIAISIISAKAISIAIVTAIAMTVTIARPEDKTIAKATAEGKIVAKAIAEDTIIAKALGQLLQYLRGVIESVYTELALYGSKNYCARTDTVFLPICEVCNGTVSLG